jgi:hypothetical protein
MDFGALLRRAWDLVWNYKWLVLLGVIIALGSGSSSPNFNYPGGGGAPGPNFDFGNFNSGDFDNFDFDQLQRDLERDFQEVLPGLGIVLAVLIPILCILFAIGIAIWVAAQIARGGLVAAVDTLDDGWTSSFGDAWRAGWQKGWRLVGIGLVPAIPGLLLAIVVIALAAGFIGAASSSAQEALAAAGAGMIITLFAVICIVSLASLALDLLRTFAERAAMLDDTGVFESYGRGWEVLKDNAGSALILFLIQVGIGIGLAVVLFLPSLLMAICCIFWPVLLLISGIKETYFSTLWTLGYREWTGRGSAGEMVVDAAPAV